MIHISSVNVHPSSVTVAKGEWYYGAYASISSSCPECAEVRWYSNNSSIASVNATAGYIYGVNTGTTRIYAEATDGSGKKDYITVTVTAPISVTGISVVPASKTMNVGDTDYLCETVYPSNATNKTVTWSSSDESVATVNTYSGKLTAKKAGTTTITATTADGGYSASCTVRVINDTVTITKDDVSNRVIFHSSGKVWRCINQDLVFNNGNITSTPIANRSNHNFYLHWDEDNWMNSNTTGYKEYTNDEIKLLFAIDPYGVCDYIHRVGNEIDNREERVNYKDDKFRLLFNREPQYFARNSNGEWGLARNGGNLNYVLSESETYFGGHMLWDDYTWQQVIDQIVDIACLAASFIPPLVAARGFVRLANSLDAVIKMISFFAQGVTDGFVSSGMDEFVADQFEGTELGWAYSFVTGYSGLIDLLNHVKHTPNYYAQIFDYFIDVLNYDVNIEFENGEVCELKRIRDALGLEE